MGILSHEDGPRPLFARRQPDEASFRPARRRSDPVPGRKPGELKRVSTRGDVDRTYDALTSARACHYPRARSLAIMCCPLSAKRPEHPQMLPMANARTANPRQILMGIPYLSRMRAKKDSFSELSGSCARSRGVGSEASNPHPILCRQCRGDRAAGQGGGGPCECTKYQAHRALALQLCNVDISGAVLAQGGRRHPRIRHRHRFAAQSCHQESP